jgi:alcohol dehydrogenase class IV
MSAAAARIGGDGGDAMVQAIKACTGRHRMKPVSDDSLAHEALRLLGAMLAGQAFANSPRRAVHALAYPLGGHQRLAHGRSNDLIVGPVLRLHANTSAPLYAQLVGVLRPRGRPHGRNRAADGRQWASLGRRRVKEDSLALLAVDAMKQTHVLVNNPG